MLIISCPSCSAKLKIPDQRTGKQAKCPKCGQLITIPSRRPPASSAAVAAQPIPSPPPVLAKQSRRDFDFDEPADQDDYEPVVAVRKRREGSAAAHSLGIASLCLGIVCLVISFIPCLGIVSLPLSGLGLLLGIIGGIVALTRSGRGIGFPIAGSALNGMAIVIALLWFGFIHTGLSSIDEMNKKQMALVQTPVAVPPLKGTDLENPRDREPEQPDWPDASKKAVEQGGIRVRVTGVGVGLVDLVGDIDGPGKSAESHLQITLSIENVTRTKIIHYRGWGTRGFLEASSASLTDNFGNSLQRVTWGVFDHPAGQVTSSDVDPGKSITDVLIFRKPIEGTKYLRLELSAENFGGTGRLRLQIPGSMIEGKQ